MSAPIVVTTRVVGGAEVAVRFSESEVRLRTRLREVLASIGERIRAGAQSKSPVDRGRLRRSFRVKVFEKASIIGVRVYNRKYYARFLEQGAGPVDARVPRYMRRNRARDVRQGRKIVQKGYSQVRAHTRRVYIATKPFLMATVRAMEDDIMEQLSAVVNGTLRG